MIRIVSDKFLEEIKAHTLGSVSFPESPAVNEIR
jgi:hypothetical protein